MALVPFRVNGPAADVSSGAEERLVQLPLGVWLRLQQRPRDSGAWRCLQHSAATVANCADAAAATPDAATAPRRADAAAAAAPGAATAPSTPPPPPPAADLSNVGLVVWQSGVLLADLLLRRPPFGPGSWPGLAVLELGAGTGLVGMALAVAGARVVLSDLAHITPLTRANVEANWAGLGLGGPPAVVEHAWGEEAAPLLRELEALGDKAEAGAVAVTGAEASVDDVRGAGGSDAGMGGTATGTAAGSAAGLGAAAAAAAVAPAATAGAAVRGYDLVVAADVLYEPAGHAPLLATLSAVAAPHALVLLAHRLRGRGEEAFGAAAAAAGWAVDALPVSALHEEFRGGEYHVLRLVHLG